MACLVADHRLDLKTGEPEFMDRNYFRLLASTPTQLSDGDLGKVILDPLITLGIDHRTRRVEAYHLLLGTISISTSMHSMKAIMKSSLSKRKS